jgi:hypothetical protein
MSEIKSLGRLVSIPDLGLLPQSLVESDGLELALASRDGEYQLLVLAETGCQHLASFEGSFDSYENGLTLLTGPASSRNLAVLQHRLPWLRPQTLGLRTSVGMGDRLGLATPGHVRALRAAGGKLAPIFAQQSIREMERTGRSAQQVMEDAVWGVFAEGWRWGFGADADHLKTPEDVDLCIAAGYTFFTFDPGEHVDGSAESADLSTLRDAVERLPWTQLEDSVEAMGDRYLSKCFRFEGHEVSFDEKTLYGAAVKYGRAVAHIAAMHRHLVRAAEGRDFEIEISVDETETLTTHAQHAYIASELQRLGVEWVSLAPRYIGQFEKGVDYIGDVDEFEADFALHASIARHFGPYKLSLHSGSDKFSIYPAAVRQARGMVHLKTAGTSYLEALRTVAELNPELFREIYAFSRDHYEKDRASYHVSASLKCAPSPQGVSDADLPSLLDQFHAREILHVTFGSVLTSHSEEGGWRFYDRFMDTLRTGSAAYATNLERHFLRHMRPFAESQVAVDVKSRGEV